MSAGTSTQSHKLQANKRHLAVLSLSILRRLPSRLNGYSCLEWIFSWTPFATDPVQYQLNYKQRVERKVFEPNWQLACYSPQQCVENFVFLVPSSSHPINFLRIELLDFRRILLRPTNWNKTNLHFMNTTPVPIRLRSDDGKNWTEKQSNLDPFTNLDPSLDSEHKILLGDPKSSRGTIPKKICTTFYPANTFSM